MSESQKSAVIAAVQRLLEPVVQLLLESGVGVGEFHQLAKRAYVSAARERATESRPNVSRIAVLTGITRVEVAALLAAPPNDELTAERGRNRAESVLHGWATDAEFLDGAGHPAALPLRGAKHSFVSLVRRYAGDPRVATLLEELVRVKAVRQHADDRIEMLSRTFVTSRWDTHAILELGERVRDLLETLLHNVKHPHVPRYHRFVVTSAIEPRLVPALLRKITEQAEALADSFQDRLNDSEHTFVSTHALRDARRLGIAIYVVDEPSHFEPDAWRRG